MLEQGITARSRVHQRILLFWIALSAFAHQVESGMERGQCPRPIESKKLPMGWSTVVNHRQHSDLSPWNSHCKFTFNHLIDHAWGTRKSSRSMKYLVRFVCALDPCLLGPDVPAPFFRDRMAFAIWTSTLPLAITLAAFCLTWPVLKRRLSLHCGFLEILRSRNA